MIMACSQCKKLRSKKIQLIFFMIEVHHKTVYTRLNIAVGALVPVSDQQPLLWFLCHMITPLILPLHDYTRSCMCPGDG